MSEVHSRGPTSGTRPAPDVRPESVPAAPVDPLPGAAGQKPSFLHDDETHIEHVMAEALAAFRKGQRDVGLINMAHAVVVAVEKREPMGVDDVRAWFREITDAAGVW